MTYTLTDNDTPVQYIENDYGKLYLTEKRAQEYMNIVSKHLDKMLVELKEHKLIPCVVSLAKTTVWEYEDIVKLTQSKELNSKDI